MTHDHPARFPGAGQPPVPCPDGAQHGFVRTADLDDLAIPQVYVRKLAAAGRADHRARGIYRLTAIPVTARDEYHEAVLWAGDGAAVAGEATLALWDLADVNPRHIDVVIPAGRRLRRHDAGRFRVTQAADWTTELVE